MSFKLLVGSYTAFITALSFVYNPSGGSTLSVLSQSAAGTNPSWIALNPTNKSVLYASQENEQGQILAFVVEGQTGKLIQTGSVPTGGSSPAHFLVLESGREIYAANYGSGSASDIVLGVDVSQLPGSAGPTVNFTGPDTFKRSNPHQVVEYTTDQELLVPDLGSDQVWRLTRSLFTGGWQVTASIAQPAGSGPRHVATHSGSLYTLHEKSNTLTQQTLPPIASGIASELIATLSIIPSGASSNTFAAGELLLSPQNTRYPSQYLYATNRDDPDPSGDSIAIFSLDPLALVTQVRTGLKHLRGAAIGGENGEYLVVGGMKGGGVVVYERTNGGAGLTELARLANVESPTSFAFF